MPRGAPLFLLDCGVFTRLGVRSFTSMTVVETGGAVARGWDWGGSRQDTGRERACESGGRTVRTASRLDRDSGTVELFWTNMKGPSPLWY